MKSKKNNQEKEIEQIRIPQKSKGQIASGRKTLTKRKDDRANKENRTQTIGTLEGNTLPSKEFALSQTIQRDSTDRKHRIDLKEIKMENIDAQKASHCSKSKEKSAEQELFQRRLSLNCASNYSQQLQYQKSQRYSMIPLRKASSTTLTSQQGNEERDSLCTYYDNSTAIGESKSRHSFKKQAIITNLMNKLDHEEDLRSIIELKLKTGSNCTNSFAKQRKNQGYSDLNEDSLMSSKLKQCENELSYFKSIIKQMSQKLVELTPQKKTSKREYNFQQSEHESLPLKNDLLQLIKMLTQNNQCKNCEKSKKSVKEIGIQTGNEPDFSWKRTHLNDSSDFLDNIERTLKVLGNNH